MASAPSEKDLQELLRLLTTTRKLPIMQAMSQVKALQAANLRSIRQIADAPPADVQAAIKDAAGAKALQASCKTAVKKMDKAGKAGSAGAGSKRPADDQGGDSSGSKRARPFSQPALSSSSAEHPYLPAAMTPADLERSLELPVFVPGEEEADGDGDGVAEKTGRDEDRMAATVLLTNRAPLMLAFAVELLRYTMPEQPPSSRLSLAQAVVSANARSRAANLGMAWARGSGSGDGNSGNGSREDDWGAGQPRVRIMGRQVAVLKRGGYTWRGEEDVEGESAVEDSVVERKEEEEEEEKTEARETQGLPEASKASEAPAPAPAQATLPASSSSLSPLAPLIPTVRTQPPPGVWSVSPTISLRGSTFVAYATTMTDPATQRAGLIRAHMTAHPRLLSATHNAWAYRVRSGGGGPDGDSDYAARMRQDAYDDGETGCGDFMLRVLAELGAVDILVVLTRWFGGTMLGPDRWRLMRNCVTGALAERLRRTGAEVALGGEALWALDLEGRSSSSTAGSAASSSSLTAVVGMSTHRPEAARQYLLKSFATAEDTEEKEPKTKTKTNKKRKMTVKALEAEKEENLALLLGALRMLYDSWADHLTAAELDRRAWSWYAAVRPDVDIGPAGWGAKGKLRLKDILDLRRPPSSKKKEEEEKENKETTTTTR